MLEHFFKSLVATVSDPYQCNRITDALDVYKRQGCPMCHGIPDCSLRSDTDHTRRTGRTVHPDSGNGWYGWRCV